MEGAVCADIVTDQTSATYHKLILPLGCRSRMERRTRIKPQKKQQHAIDAKSVQAMFRFFWDQGI